MARVTITLKNNQTVTAILGSGIQGPPGSKVVNEIVTMGATHTVLISDIGKLHVSSEVGGTVVTVPNDLTLGFHFKAQRLGGIISFAGSGTLHFVTPVTTIDHVYGEAYFTSPIAGEFIVALTSKADYVLNNTTATTDPGITNDSSEGYAALSIWINTVTSEIWKCLSAAVGAADWQLQTLTLDDLGTMAVLNAGSAGTEFRNNTENEALFATTDYVDAADRDNGFDNGRFNIWEWQVPGVSLTLSNDTGYLADRWRCIVLGSASATIDKGEFVVGQTDVPNNPKNYMIFDITTADDSSDTGFDQAFEGVENYAGQEVTIDLYLEHDGVGVGNIQTIRCLQIFGSGGDATVTTEIADDLAITTGMNKYSMTVNIPSITGKTLGAVNTDTMIIQVLFSDATKTGSAGSGEFGIAECKIAEGNISNPIIPRKKAEELSNCQYFHYRWHPDFVTTRHLAQTADAPYTTLTYATMYYPNPLRVNATHFAVSAASHFELWDGQTASIRILTGMGVGTSSKTTARVTINGTSFSVNESYHVRSNNNSAFVDVAAEYFY